MTPQETLDNLRSFADDLRRLSKDVGAEGVPTTESIDVNWDYGEYVDPRGAYWDAYGHRWLGASRAIPGREKLFSGWTYTTEEELFLAIDASRRLVTHNEYAQGCVKTRVAYLVGSGHGYSAVTKKDRSDVPDDVLVQAQSVIDHFVKVNRWPARQREIVTRNDRDGASMLRFFRNADNFVLVRFVEPRECCRPDRNTDENALFGVLTDPKDVETVLAYFVNGERVEPDEIQHRKYNVDFNSKRGVPSFFSVADTLDRVERVNRTSTATVEVQAAIAMVIKYVNATAAQVEDLMNVRADARATDPRTGKSQTFERFSPGNVFRTNADVEFPQAMIDVSRVVTLLQSQLRAVGVRFVMPEYMISGDASNANLASHMVSESPAVKNFETDQREMITWDLEIFERQLVVARDEGVTIDGRAVRLPSNVLDVVEIEVTPPLTAVRKRMEEVSADCQLNREGHMSPQTLAAKHGLDYDQEQENFLAHQEVLGQIVNAAPPPPEGEGDDDERGAAA